MRILVVSGIWPPDVGGPASHGPDVAAFLSARGHDVRAVVAADAQPAARSFEIDWVSRGLPKGVVHLAAATAVARIARTSDVVYTTGMFGRTAVAAAAVRTPYVVKLTGDPAFERARWRGRVGGDVEAFQGGGGGLEVAVLRRSRDLTLRRAAHVVCPSGFLRDLALGWGLPPARVSVLPNPAPPIPALPPRAELRSRLGVSGLVFAFAGRLGPQKSLDVALAAIERIEGATLLVAGEGELRATLEAQAGPQSRFLGTLAREGVLELFAAADAAVLSSSWENFPHSVVEALAVGAPVIATTAGGVPEVVTDGVNGLLVPPGDVDAFAGALARFAADASLRERLSAAAKPSVERYSEDAIYGKLEQILLSVAG